VAPHILNSRGHSGHFKPGTFRTLFLSLHPDRLPHFQVDLPRTLGALMVFVGLVWLTYLSNPLVNYLPPTIWPTASSAGGWVFL
jgi:hypothetical protein